MTQTHICMHIREAQPKQLYEYEYVYSLVVITDLTMCLHTIKQKDRRDDGYVFITLLSRVFLR